MLNDSRVKYCPETAMIYHHRKMLKQNTPQTHPVHIERKLTENKLETAWDPVSSMQLKPSLIQLKEKKKTDSTHGE